MMQASPSQPGALHLSGGISDLSLPFPPPPALGLTASLRCCKTAFFDALKRVTLCCTPNLQATPFLNQVL